MTQENIMIGVGGIIFDEQARVLLVKHVPEKRGFWEDRWILPGGMLELGESLQEGALREVREEVGLECGILEHVSTLDRILRRDGKVSLHIIYIDYLMLIEEGEPDPGSDVGDAQWFAESEVRDMGAELHEDTDRILKNIGWL